MRFYDVLLWLGAVVSRILKIPVTFGAHKYTTSISLVLRNDLIYSNMLTQDEESVARWLPDEDGTVTIHLITHVPQDRVDTDLALGAKPVYYLKEGQEDNKENTDPNLTGVLRSDDQGMLERDIFGGSLPLLPVVSRAVNREVSWCLTTLGPGTLCHLTHLHGISSTL